MDYGATLILLFGNGFQKVINNMLGFPDNLGWPTWTSKEDDVAVGNTPLTLNRFLGITITLIILGLGTIVTMYVQVVSPAIKDLKYDINRNVDKNSQTIQTIQEDIGKINQRLSYMDGQLHPIDKHPKP